MVTNFKTDAVFQIVVIGWKVVWNGWNGVLSGGLLFSHPPIISVSYLTLAASEVRNWMEPCPRMIKHSDLHIADGNLDDRSVDPTETLSEAVLNHAPN